MTTEMTKLWHIDAIKLLEGVPYDDKVQFEKLVVTKSHKKNEFIFKSGDAAEEVYFVASGRIKIGKHAENTKECIKRIINEGEMFGELGVVDNKHNETRNNFAQVMEHDTTICSMSLNNFKIIF